MVTFKIKMHIIKEIDQLQSLNLKFNICGVDIPQIDFKRITYSSEDFKVLLSFLKKSEKYNKEDLCDYIKDIIYNYKENYNQIEMTFIGAIHRTDIFKFIFRIPYEYVPLFINSTEKDIIEIYLPWRLKIGK